MTIHGPHPIPEHVKSAVSSGAPYYYAANAADDAIAPERLDQLEAERDVELLSKEVPGVHLRFGQWIDVAERFCRRGTESGAPLPRLH